MAVTTHNLPLQSMAFVGRTQELAEIGRLLVDPQCRLLTLTGPGGIGKTRLAIEAAAQAEAYRDGVYFVGLQPVRSSDFLVSTIADAVNLQFYPGGEPKSQLLDYFREKALLLVLDNFEHLLDGAELVSDILTHAPAVKILTTSRERLNLREEWALDVRGLRFPLSEADVAEIEDYSAIQLFLQNAQRVQVGFILDDAQKRAVIHICRMVGGMPLGIELASAWVRALSCEAIAGEIERNLDILESPARNVPPRHRNMRAVLDHSWNRLSAAEQDTFKKLSVFRGGFTREAAQAVAGASLRLLSALVDKSLLWCDPAGRYSLHELLRQYGEEHLNTSSEDSAAVHGLHCAYYAAFMQQREVELFHAPHRNSQREGLTQIEGELENVRMAFLWATEWGSLLEIRQFATSLWCFLEIRGLHHEGRETFRRAVEHLRERRDEPEEERLRLLGRCLTNQGLFSRFVAPIEEGLELAQESLAILRPLTNTWDLLGTFILLSNFAIEYEQAKQFLQEARAIGDVKRDGWTAAAPIQVLAQLAVSQEDYAEAKQLSQEALTICRAVNDHILEAYVLLDLSNIAFGQEEYAQAIHLAQEALVSARAVDHRLMILRTQRCLGNIAYIQGDYAAANRYYLESLTTSQNMGNRWGIASAFRSLGYVACRSGKYPEANAHFHEALKTAADIHNLPEILNVVAGIAELFALEGQQERAAELTTLVLNHPASGQDTKDRIESVMPTDQAKRLYADLETELPPDVFAAACTRGRMRDLHATAKELLADLSQPIQDIMPAHPTSTAQVLSDALTERELEILHLLAEGLSNREVAEHLVLALSTVKWYVGEIFSKLHVASRTQAIARARELNLLS